MFVSLRQQATKVNKLKIPGLSKLPGNQGRPRPTPVHHHLHQQEILMLGSIVHVVGT